jgi:transcriptional regulator with XRE-family HTH domain
MDGTDLRKRRRELGLTQQEFAEKLGLSRDYVGQMERDKAPINVRTEAAILLLGAAPGRPEQAAARPRESRSGKLLRKLSSDPMEYLIETALIEAGEEYQREGEPGAHQTLDFYLPRVNVFIEVKRFHSDRIAAQMKREANVIAAQGEPAVRFLAELIRSGRVHDLTK